MTVLLTEEQYRELREGRDEDMLAHYSAALDEIFRLRQAAAVEAMALYAVLGYRTLPKTVRERLEAARERLLGTAQGWDRHRTVSADSRAFAMRDAKASPTLPVTSGNTEPTSEQET